MSISISDAWQRGSDPGGGGSRGRVTLQAPGLAIDLSWLYCVQCMEPLRFVGEEIMVEFDRPPALEKKPGPPERFMWRNRKFGVVEILGEWHDFSRRGRMAHNMRPDHALAAARRGSWGVGRDYFRVRVDTGQVFDIYYDRSPRSACERKGVWYLFREMKA